MEALRWGCILFTVWNHGIHVKSPKTRGENNTFNLIQNTHFTCWTRKKQKLIWEEAEADTAFSKHSIKNDRIIEAQNGLD